MADGKVIITLSVKDAEAVRAWQRSKESIEGMQEELRGASSATANLSAAATRLSKTQVSGWQAMSAAGRQAFANSTTWSRGLATLERQRADEGKKAAEAQQAADRAAAAVARKEARRQLAAERKARAEAKQAAREQAAAERRTAREAAKVAREHERAAASAETLGNYVRGQVANWASYATAVGIATQAVRALVDANKEVRGEEADVTFTLDTEFRRLQVQGQFTEGQSAGVRAQIFDIAERQAAKTETVAGVAKQLISSGFDRDVVLQGGAAEELIKGMQASAMAEGETANPAQFTEAITQFLMAQTGKEEGEKLSGQESKEALSFENLSAAVRQTQGLFLRHNMQFADLTYLARAAPALSRAGMSMTEQLAAFTRLRDVLKPEQAGTELRNIVSRMQTAGASKDKAAALAEIGLEAGDIDLVGESFDEALKRLRDALANVDKNKQAIVLKKLFEEEGAQAASVLISEVPKLAQYREEAKDTSAFDAALATSTQGMAAAKQREETQKQRARFGGEGAEDALIEEAIELEYTKRGHEVVGKLRRKEFAAMRAVGVGVDRALSMLDFDKDVAYGINLRVAKAKQTPGDMTRVDDQFRPLASPPTGAAAAAPGEPTDAAAETAAADERRRRFAARAAETRAAAAAAAQAKVEEKKRVAETKAAAAADKRTRTEADRKTAGLRRQADKAGKAAVAARKQEQTDEAAIAELRRQRDFRRQVSAAAAGETANKGTGRGKKRSPRKVSAAAQLREQEAIRRLELRIEEAERKRDEHEAEAQKKLDEQTKILAQIAANTANPEVTVKNPGDAGRQSRAANPPRPPMGRKTP